MCPNSILRQVVAVIENTKVIRNQRLGNDKINTPVKNVFEEGELKKEVVVAKNATTTQHGAIEGKTQTNETVYG